jgi:hypothetical protein
MQQYRDDGCSLAMPVTGDLHFMPLPICSERSLIETFARSRRSDPFCGTGSKELGSVSLVSTDKGKF